MGCASSKPSSSSTTTSKSHKKKDKTSPAKSDQIAPSNDGANSKKASSLKTNGTTPQQPGEITTNGSLNESKSPLHLKQQAQAERARRLAHHLHIDESLLHEIDQQRNRVITYLVTSVRRDLNSELIAAHSGSKNLADLVMAAAAATDNDDLITDVVSRAVLLILNGTAGHSYKDLSDQLKSHQYLCKHQQHKQRICEITVDTIYGAIEGGGGQTLAEFLTGETSQQQQQQHQVNRTPQMGDSNGGNNQQEAVLLSRSQAKEVARILFLTDRARPVVHASPNSAHKDAYFVNKQLSDMSEVSVSKTEIDEILRAFERPEPIEIAALAPRSKNLIDDFNSITLEPVQPPQPPQTVTRIVIDGEETIPTDVTIQYEDQPTTQQSDKVEEETANLNPNAAQEALDTLVAISALATKLNNERLSNNGEQEVVVVDEKPIVKADSNNNNLVVVSESIVVVDTSSENINNNSSISSSSAHVEHNEDANTQENGELDPTLKQSLLDDRFYNNDAFKTEPPVNGENLDEAATVIQASFKGHQERKETDETNEEVEATAETAATNVVVINEPKELERSESNDNDQPQETPLTPKPSLQEINQPEVQQEVPQETPKEAPQEAPQEVQQEVQQETPQEVPHHHHEIHNEAEAATMIQATFRGYKARKELKEGSTKSPESTPHLSPEPPKQEEEENNSSSAQEAESTPSGQEQTESSTSKSTNDLDHAATKIQATFRGFRARKEFSARKDEDLKTKKKTKNLCKNTNNNNNNLLKTGASSSLPSLNASASLNIDHDPNEKELTLNNKEKNDDLVNDNNNNNNNSNNNIINNGSLLTTTNNNTSNNINQYCSQDYLSASAVYSREDISRSDDRMEQMLNRAATKIQSTFRGYKTRKNISKQSKKSETMTKSKSQPNCSSARQHSPITDPEKAAVKIQATFRGYKTRKQLEASRSANASISANLGGSNNCVHTVQSDYHRNVKLEGRQTKLK